MKKFLQSPHYKTIICGIAFLIGSLLIFQGGIIIGYQKALYAHKLNDDVRSALDRKEYALYPERVGGAMLPGNHGAAGEIVAIDLPEITVADISGVEKHVVIGEKTLLRQYQTNIDANALRENMQIIVFGSPRQNGQIDATFIRVTNL